MSRKTEDFVLRALAYFPGQWTIKSDDGSMAGFVRWTAEAGGKALVGSGTMRNNQICALAGWDPGKGEWVHTLVEENGAFGQMIVTEFRNDIYIGTFYFVDSDGEGETHDWSNEIIDNDRFKVTEFVKGQKVVLHFHRQ